MEKIKNYYFVPVKNLSYWKFKPFLFENNFVSLFLLTIFLIKVALTFKIMELIIKSKIKKKIKLNLYFL